MAKFKRTFKMSKEKKLPKNFDPQILTIDYIGSRGEGVAKLFTEVSINAKDRKGIRKYRRYRCNFSVSKRFFHRGIHFGRYKLQRNFVDVRNFVNLWRPILQSSAYDGCQQ